jgi:hypothetical protein
MLSLEDILEAMRDLSTQRPIFHSEADFQHALAWYFHQQFPDAHIRLEYPLLANGKRIHLDLYG